MVHRDTRAARHHASPHDYHHPEGNSYIERFHRSLKEDEIWMTEYQSLAEAWDCGASGIENHNDWPHRRIQNRTLREAFFTPTGVSKNEALTV